MPKETPRDQQTLVFRLRSLKDGRSLADHDIQKGIHSALDPATAWVEVVLLLFRMSPNHKKRLLLDD